MKIEVWSDIACPFCYIGKRNLETALEGFEHRERVQVEWRSYQLNPQARVAEGVDIIDYLVRKTGRSREQVSEMQEQLAAHARTAGLDMKPGTAVHTNTRDAHRLVHLARTHGLADEMQERLFSAYFTENLDVGRHDVLRQLGAEVGLDEDSVEGLLSGDEFAYEVHSDQQEAADFGVQGVPFFVLDRKYGVSGAQPVEVFSSALRDAWQENHAQEQ